MADDKRKIIILEAFRSEAELLHNASAAHLVRRVTKDDGELFPKGMTYYDPVEAIAERGLVATTRLFLTDETLFFGKVANLVSSVRGDEPETIKRIRAYKKEFDVIKRKNREMFDRYANISHLHVDISNQERYKEHFNIRHSCMGVPDHVRLLNTIQEVALITKRFSDEYVLTTLDRLRIT